MTSLVLNPSKSRTVLILWIAAEVLVAGWIGWKYATATVTPWAPPKKRGSP